MTHRASVRPEGVTFRIAEYKIAALTAVLLAASWIVLIYWAVSSRERVLEDASLSLIQMSHAVEQNVTGVIGLARVFQDTTELWLANRPDRDPRGDADFLKLIESYRSRSDHLIDIRMIDRSGSLFYFPGDPARPRDRVSDREYFKAAIAGEPGEIHIGTPVISRVSNDWRMPVTVRMKRPSHELEIINASINLSGLLDSFERERPRPRGAISVWRTDRRFMVGTPLDPDAVGRPLHAGAAGYEQMFRLHAGTFRANEHGEPRLVGFTQSTRFPLVMAISLPVADVLAAWQQQIFGVGLCLGVVTLLGLLLSINIVRTSNSLACRTFELARMAIVDPLTGCFNRRHFFDVANQAFRLSTSKDRTLSIILLDIDRFKAINDRWGHPVGDSVLQAFVKLALAAIREGDLFARIGGEEFAVLLPDTGKEQALEVANRILSLLREAGHLTLSDTPVTFTASIGVATLDAQDASLDALIARADQRLYQAKAAGRDRVIAEGMATP